MTRDNEPTAVRYRRIFEVLANISNTIAQGVGLDALIGLIARETIGLVHADSCSVMLLDEDGEQLLCKAGSGLSREEMEAITFKLGEGVAGWVGAHGQPASISDVTQDTRFLVKPQQHLQIRALLCVPLKVRESVIGVVTVTRSEPRAFSGEDQEVLSFLANAVVLDVENARLYRLSVTDPLTKVCNRQYLRERLPDEIDRARRFKQPLALLMLDVDNFKDFNDNHGHHAGDIVLRGVASIMRSALRDIDTVARYGGEEFVVVLPNSDLSGGIRIAERLRQSVEGSHFNVDDSALQVTVSIGVAELTADVADDSALLRRADQALYRAKGQGRNKAVPY